MNFFEHVGKVALGSRVRFLGESITTDAAQIYKLYNIQMQPKWFPVFYVLSQSEAQTITALASAIAHSHVSVSKIVAEMLRAGLVVEKSSRQDRRRTLVQLSRKGRAVAQKIEAQYSDVRAAVEEIGSQSRHDLWAALEEWEQLLAQKSLLHRVVEKKKQRESGDVQIVPYQAKYRTAFRRLNEQWITEHFKLEQADRDALGRPQEYILTKGGFIFVALSAGKVLGVCALLKCKNSVYHYELAKMAVAPEARGRGIGWLLGQAAIAKARAEKAQRIFLESNTKLKPAIGLYERLGFQKIVGPPTPYERCNIQMELRLTHRVGL